MSLDKELQIKKQELSRKEEELERKQKDIESFERLLKKSYDAFKEYPELLRSKTVEEIKKSHREIEKHSRKESGGT